MNRFFRYVLRTRDVTGARGFYATLLGDGELDVFPLHEEAVARGARPHWLGQIAVDDVDATVEALVARGATRLGPTVTTAEGRLTVLRDPGGAVVGLATTPRDPRSPRHEVAWHELNTTDLAGSLATYGSVFGWEARERLDVGASGVTCFAFAPGEPICGSMADVAGRPGVHPHWLLHFPVPSLRRAADAVRAKGGVVAAEVSLPDGSRVAVCDDPQGAAFALRGE